MEDMGDIGNFTRLCFCPSSLLEANGQDMGGKDWARPEAYSWTACKSTVGCMICNALKPGNSCCSSQRSANDILSMIRFVVFT